MAHKTITISEDAYNALKSAKNENESFTDVILRVFKKRKNITQLLEWLDKNEKLDDLADAVQEIYDKRDRVKLRY